MISFFHSCSASVYRRAGYFVISNARSGAFSQPKHAHTFPPFNHFCIHIFHCFLKKQIFPIGQPDVLERVQLASVDRSNRSLVGQTRRIVAATKKDDEHSQQPSFQGAETPVVDPKTGNVYFVNEESFLVSLSNLQVGNDADRTSTMDAQVVRHLGSGRPLGGAIDGHGMLYIADAVLGLLRIALTAKHPSLEIIASGVTLPDGSWSPLNYANDVCIGPKTGKIYFTDASDIRSDRTGNTWDTLYASKVDLLRGRPAGRILSFDPKTQNVDVVATGIRFANGISVDKNEQYLIVAETFGPRILKYELTTGTTNVLIDTPDLPGYPDGVDCAGNKCYAAIPSSIVPLHRLVNALPGPMSVLLRGLVMALPRRFAPNTKPYGGIIEFDIHTGASRLYQDPLGEDVSFLTGVAVHEGKLFLGSLKKAFVGVMELN